MSRLRLVTAGLAVALIVPAAVSAQHGGHAAPAREQPAARSGAMSAKEIDDLAAGRGMGLASAADLNGYPGPRHVLDAATAGQLVLTEEQRREIERVFAGMEARAKQLGARIISDEDALERAFRGRAITEADLAERVRGLAALQGELREVHLRAHLATRALLTDAQVARYDALRGGGHRP